MSNFHPLMAIMTAKAATGIGAPMLVADFKNVMLQLIGTGTAVFTVKFQGSYSDEMPDFVSAQSDTNAWDYVEVVDLQDGTVIDGDTGITFSAADVRNVELNTNGMQWVCARITAFTSGALTVKLKAYDNE